MKRKSGAHCKQHKMNEEMGEAAAFFSNATERA